MHTPRAAKKPDLLPTLFYAAAQPWQRRFHSPSQALYTPLPAYLLPGFPEKFTPPAGTDKAVIPVRAAYFPTKKHDSLIVCHTKMGLNFIPFSGAYAEKTYF